MNYEESLAWLYSTQWTGIKLGLETISRLLGALDFKTSARIVHVAGTNGKGSVCAMLAAMCEAQGFRTGLYTSPHLVDFRERIQVDGRPIPKSAVAAGLTHLRDLTADWQPSPTFFEFATALALDWFQRQAAEVIVLETGLGGRLDATNAVTPSACALASIDFDHMAWLGDTLTAIAGEKAGIIKPGVPVVSVPQEAEAAAVIERVAREQGANLRIITAPLPDGQPLGLAGSHQRLNAALALAAAEAAGIELSEDARRRGLENVRWPGRFQRLEKGAIILDGAHNPAAARRLARTWSEEYGEHHRATVILGVLGDKDVEAICRALAPIAACFIPVPVQNPRSLSAEQLRPMIERVAEGAAILDAPDLASAIGLGRARARQCAEPILIAGSLFLVGEALALLTGEPAPRVSAQ
jgi:dihydrofolate synthase/folylpolyglutamate synthase